MSHNIWRRWVSRLFKRNFRTRVRKQLHLHPNLRVESLEDRVVPATPGTDIWTGLGTGVTAKDWSNVSNWSLGRVPITGDTVSFPTITNGNLSPFYNLTTNPALYSINISGIGYSLTGTGEMIVTNGISVGSGVNTVSMAQQLEFLPPPAAPAENILVNNGSVLDLTGPITAGTSVTVSKTGIGTLILGAASPNWLGNFTLANSGNPTGGYVEIANQQALGSTVVTVNNGTQLQLVAGSGKFAIPNSLLISGSGLAGDGGLLNVSGNNAWTGPVQMDANTTFGTDAGTNLTIGIEGSTGDTNAIGDNGTGYSLTKEGPGTLILPDADTYRGQTIINNGILEIENPLSLGAGANFLDKQQSGKPSSETIVNYNATNHEVGTLELNFNTTDVLTTDPDALVGSLFQYYQNSDLATQSAAKPNSIDGFQVFNDILVLNGPGFNPGTGGLGALYNAAGDNEWDGSVILGSSPPALANPFINTAANTQLLASGIINDPNQVSSVNKIGTGELIINNANTYASSTNIDAGILDIADSTALGTGTVSVVYGAELQLDVDQGIDGTYTNTNGVITPLRSDNRNLGFDSTNGSGLGQELDITVNGTAGSFTLSTGGKTATVANIAATNLATQIKTAINSLLTQIGFTGDSVSFVTQDDNVYRAIFTGPNTTLPLFSVSATTGNASAIINPVSDPSQELNITGTSGSFTLYLGGYSVNVPSITSNTLPAQIQSAINTLLTDAGYTMTVNSVKESETVSTVTQDGNLYRIFYTGPFTDIPDVAVTASTGTASVLVNPDYGLTVANTLFIQGPGFGTSPNTGALESHSGINTYTGQVTLEDTSWPLQRATTIGVDLDNRTGHTLADDNYLQWDYGLTVEGAILGGDLIKSGLGNLILPNDNTYGNDYDNTGAFIEFPGDAVTWNNGVVTVNTFTPTFFIPGDRIEIYQLTPIGYNGVFTVASVLSPTEFTYDLPINPGPATYYLPDPLTPAPYVRLLPGDMDPTTDIQLGWITIDNNQSLGSNFTALGQNFSPATVIPDAFQLNPEYPVFYLQTLEPYVQIDKGGALHLDPLPGQPNLNMYNNFLLSGNGLTSQNYGLIEQAGAIQNLNGDNTLPGIIQLNGNAGIGVEQIPPNGTQFPAVNSNPPDTGFPELLPTSPPLTASQLTITGFLQNYVNAFTGATTVGGITKLGSRRLVIEGSGNYTGAVNIDGGVLLDQNNTGLGAYNSIATVTVAAGAALEFGNSVNDEDQGSGSSPPTISATENGGVQNGVEVWDETLYLNGSGDSTFEDSALSVLAGNAATTGPTVYTVTVTGSATSDFFLGFNGLSTGAIPANATAGQVQTALTSILPVGGSVVVTQNANVYTVTFGGNLINTAIPLVVNNLFAVSAGVAEVPALIGVPQVVNGNLVVNGNFTLTYTNGANNVVSTGQLAANATAAQVQAALAAVASPGQTVAVTLSNGEYTITFGGTGTLPTQVEVFTGTFAVVQNTQIGTTTSNLAPVYDPIVATDTIWRGPVILGDSTTITADTNSTLPANQTASRMILSGTVSDVYLQNNIGNDTQTITISPTATGTFTLSYTGPNNLGSSVTATTGNLHFSSTTLASDIQNALNALANISGVGGSVSVSETAVNVYTITFGGTFAGQPVSTLTSSSSSATIADAAGSPSNLTITGGGEVDLDGANTYSGTTYVQQGVLSVGNGAALGTSGIPEIQTLTLTGITTGNSFTLDFPGYGYASTGLPLPGVPTSTALTAAIKYTGNVATDEANIENALDAALSTSSSGETDAAGSVAVVETITSGTPTLQFTFGGRLSGFPLGLLSAASPSFASVTASEIQQGEGGTLVENGSTLEVAGSFTVGGEPLLLEGNGTTQAVQTVTLTGTSTGSFRLGFIGPDTVGGVNVTDDTGLIPVPNPLNSGSLAAFGLAIQNALDALPNIGGMGGSTTVTVQQPVPNGTVTITIAFGGTLSGQNVQNLVTDPSALTGGTLSAAATTTTGSKTIANVPTQWFSVGPYSTQNGQVTGSTAASTQVSGQITSEAVDPNDPNVIYVGTAGGGLWKTIDGGLSWHPVFDAIPEVQIVEVTNGSSGSFTLTFDGQTTTALNPNSSTLALQIQAALDALPNIGGVGGQVTVSQYSDTATNSIDYMVTFNGSLAGQAVNLVTVNTGSLTGTVTAIEFQGGQGVSNSPSQSPNYVVNPDSSIYVGAVTINPDNSQIIYVGTGILTNNDGYAGGYAGTGVYESTDSGLTWTLMLDDDSSPGTTNPVTDTTLINPFFGMGVSGIAVEPDLMPDAPPGTIPTHLPQFDTVFVTDGVVASTYPGIFPIPNPTPYPDTSPYPGDYVGEPGDFPFGLTDEASEYGFGNGVPDGGDVSAAYPHGDALVGSIDAPGPGYTLPDELTYPYVNNAAAVLVPADGLVQPGGTGQLAGVWKFTPDGTTTGAGAANLGQWQDITAITISARTTDDGMVGTPPFNPGPNDDFRVGFPEEGDVRWTDVQVLPNTIESYDSATEGYFYQDEWSVYAALGSPGTNAIEAPDPTPPYTDGGVNGANAVFWGDGNGNWWLGTQQTPRDQVETITLTDPSGAGGEWSLEFNGVYTGENIGGPFNYLPIAPYNPANNSPAALAAYALAIQDSLNVLSTIEDLGVPGFVTVTPVSAAGDTEVYNVTFEGGLSDSPQSLFISFPAASGGLGAALGGSVGITITVPGGGYDNEPIDEFPTWIAYYDSDVLDPPIGRVMDFNPFVPDNGYITFSGAWEYLPLPPLPDGLTGAIEPNGPDDGIAGFDDNVYASIANSHTGDLESIYKTEGQAGYTEFWTTNGSGFNWLTILDPTTGNGGTGLDDMNGQGNYDNAIVQDPTNFNIVYIGGGSLQAANGDLTNPIDMIYMSTNSGTTWTNITNGDGGTSTDSTHNSVHALEYDGNNIIAGTDGGIWSLNAVTNNWDDLNSNLDIAAVNGVSADQSNDNELVVGTEGNGLAYFNGSSTWIESDENISLGSVLLDGEPVGSGSSGGTVFIDPDNTNIVYAVLSGPFGGGQTPAAQSTIGGGTSILVESDDGGKTWFQITSIPTPLNSTVKNSLIDTTGAPYFPFLLDPLDPNRILLGGEDGLFQSLNGGATWQTLELNSNLPLGTGVVGWDPTAVAVAGYQGAFVADPGFPDVTDTGSSKDDPNTIYAAAWYFDPATGLETQGLFVTKDQGLDWLIRTPPINGAIEGDTLNNGTIESITVNPANRDNVFVVTSGSPEGGQAQENPSLGYNQIWESNNAGQSWTLIGGAGSSSIPGLPDIALWQLAVDPRNGNLYIGTDDGVYTLTNAVPITPQGEAAIPSSGSWVRFGTGMPDASVTTLTLNLSTNTLLAGTDGGGVYQLFLDAPETATDPLYVNGSETIVLPASGALMGLSGSSFWAGPVVLAGDAASNTVTIGSDGTQGLPDGITAASVNIVGQISDVSPASNVTLDKDGYGDVIFSGPNIYGGATNVDQGNLIADNLTALGQTGPNSGTTVVAGASLGLLDNLDSEQVTINGNGFAFDGHYLGSLVNISGDNTFTGNLIVNTPAADATVQSVTIGADSGTILTMTGTISGGSADLTLIKESTGTLVFDDSNTYTGTTVVAEGALQAENSNAFSYATEPTNTVEQLDGAQVQLEGPEDVQTLTETLTGGTFALSYTGPDSTGTIVTDTTSLITLNATSPTLASDMQNSLDALSNIGGAGANVTVTEAPYQTIDIPATATGSFTLSYTGVDATGTVVKDTTPLLSIVPSYGTLALDIENALNDFSNIVGIGASVSVVQQAPGVFAVTFGGNLTGQYVPLLGVDNTNVSNGTITVANTFSIAFGGSLIGQDLTNNLAVKNVTLAPTAIGTVTSQNSQKGSTIAVANPLNISGNGGNTLAAVQDIQTMAVTAAIGNFELSFTGPDPTGATVTKTTKALNVQSASLVTDIETALNNFTNIGAVGGSVVVTKISPTVYTIAFGGSLFGEDVSTLVVTPVSLVGGTVQVATTQPGSPQIVDAGALLDLGGSNTWSGPIHLEMLPGFTPYTIDAGTVALGATAGNTLTLSGVISEEASSAPGIPNGLLPLGVLKVDPGTVALSNVNSYTGTTEVAQGVLDVQNADALGDRTTGTPASGLPTIEQIVTLSNTGPDGSAAGHFTLTFNGKTAATTLAFGASAAAVAGVIEKMDGLFASTGTVQVFKTEIDTSTDNQPVTDLPPSTNANGWDYTVIFGGSMNQTPLQLQAIGALGTTAFAGVVAQGGVDTLVDSNANGTGELELDNSSISVPLVVSKYTVTINGYGPNGTAPTSSIGATGNGALYNLIGNNSWTGPVILTSDSSVGVNSKINGLQQIVVPGSNLSSTAPFTLSFTYQGTTNTTTQQADVGAAGLQAALNALPSIQTAGGVVVTQSGNIYNVLFNGAIENVPLLSITTGIPGASVGASIDSSLKLTDVLSTQSVDNQQASESTEPILDKVDPGTLIFPLSLASPPVPDFTGQTIYTFNTNDVLTDLGRTIVSDGDVEVDDTGMGPIILAGGTVSGTGSVANISNLGTPLGVNLTVSNTNPDAVYPNVPDTYTPSAADIGDTLDITGGSGWTTGNYQIIGVSDGQWILNASPDAEGSNGGQWTLLVPATSGGTIDPGDNYPSEGTGTLTSNGNVILNPTDTVFVDLQLPASTTIPPSGPTVNDVLVVDGSLSLGGANLNGIVNTAIQIDNSYTIINDPAGLITGVFNGASVTPTESGAYAATIAYIQGVKFEVDYFTTHIDVIRELVNETMTLTATLPSTTTDQWPTYGQDEEFVATLKSTDPSTPTITPPVATGTVVFTVAEANPANLIASGANLSVSGTSQYEVAPVAPDTYAPSGADIGDILYITGGTGWTTAAYLIKGYDTTNGDWILASGTGAPAAPANLLAAGGQWSLYSATNYAVQMPTNPATGSATLDLPEVLNGPLQEGFYIVTASYNGIDANGNFTFQPQNDVQLTLPSSLPTLPPPPPAPYPSFTEPGTSEILVLPAPTATTLSLNYPSPAVFGEPFTITASVSTTAFPTVPNTLAPAGTVSFYDGAPIPANLLETLTLTSPPPGVTTSTATLSSTTLANLLSPSNHVINAVYNPIASPYNYFASSSAENVAVHQATTSVVVTVSPTTTPVYGQAGITFSATVTPEDGGDPSGLVTFQDGSLVLGTGTLSTVDVSHGVNLTVSNVANTTADYVYPAAPDAYTPSTADIGDILQITGGLGWTTAAYQVVGVASIVVGGQPQEVWLVNGTQTGYPGFPAVQGTVGGDWTLYQTTASYTTTPGQLLAGGPLTNPASPPTTITASYPGDADFLASSNTLSETVNAANSKLTLTSSSSGASAYGQTVSFTATVAAVAPGAGNPTGTVNFYLNSVSPNNLIGSGTLNTVNGVTSYIFSTTTLPVGTNLQIIAVYGGDFNFNAAPNASVTQTVTQSTPSTTVTTSGPSVYGQPVTLTATVTPPTGGTIPTGTVSFYRQNTGVNLTVSNSNDLEVTPDGYLPSTADIGQTLQITGGLGWTTGTYQIVNVLISESNGQLSGQWVLNASPAVEGTTSGQWTLTTSLGSGNLGTTGGVTTASYITTVGQLPVPLLPNTTDTIVAVYNGNTDYTTSSGTAAQTVTRDLTTTVVSSSGPVVPNGTATIYAQIIADSPGGGNPVNGEPVNFTVTLPNNSVIPLGTGTVTTTNGVSVARITVSWSQLSSGDFSVGNNTINASYAGDDNLVGSNGSFDEVYQDTVSLSVTSAPSTSVYGQPVTLAAAINPNSTTPTSPITVSPSGTVTFLLGTTVLGTATVGSAGGGTTGFATLTVTSLPVTAAGAFDTITASYSGDTTFIGVSGTVNQTVHKDSTTTSISSTATTIRAGQTVILTSAVTPMSPGQGVPTGTVTFYRGGTVLAKVTLVNGIATLQTKLSAVGTESIYAVYSGDANDIASTSKILSIVCLPVGTRLSTTQISSSVNPSFVGEAVTFTAVVTDAGLSGSQNPSGTVSFFNGSTLMGYGTLVGSGTVTTATFTTALLPQGAYSISAVYNGNTYFAESTSGSILQTVNATPTRTSNITLSQSTSVSTYGTPVVFTATVTDTGSGTAQTPTGTVTFKGTSTTTGAVIVMGTGSLSGANGISTASVSFGALPVGIDNITATYNGDGVFAPESNLTNTLTHTVNIGTSALALFSSAPNGAGFGQAISFSAYVTIPGSNVVPQGAVEFVLNPGPGQVNLGAVVMVNGVATLTTTALPVGVSEIGAFYTGSPNLSPSATSTIFQSVTQDASKITLVTSTVSNSPITMTATVSGSPPSSAVPTGTVTFSIGINGVLVQIGTVSLINGMATITYPPGVAKGNHTIVVTYSGDADFMSSSLTEVVDFVVGRGT
jgi:autotransporter-associated beta strand protein